MFFLRIDGAHLIVIGQNAEQILQRLAGYHEAELCGVIDLDFFLTDSQTVTVYADHAEGAVFDLHQRTGDDGLVFIVADGEQGTGDHFPQQAGRQLEAFGFVHGGKFGKFLRIGSDQIEFGSTAPDSGHQTVIHSDFHRVGRQTANDVREDLGIEDNGTHLGNVGFDGFLDGGFIVKTADGDGRSNFQQQTLHNGRGTLCTNGMAADGNGFVQCGFFTGKTHDRVTPFFLM